MHSWVNTSTDLGAFYYYPNGTDGQSISFPPEFNTALVFDGSTIVHGTDVWKPWIEPPQLDSTTELYHVGGDRWEMKTQGKIVRKYHTHDIRMSFVWFTECEYSEEEVRRHERERDQHTVEYVLEKFVQDMRKRGILKED